MAIRRQETLAKRSQQNIRRTLRKPYTRKRECAPMRLEGLYVAAGFPRYQKNPTSKTSTGSGFDKPGYTQPIETQADDNQQRERLKPIPKHTSNTGPLLVGPNREYKIPNKNTYLLCQYVLNFVTSVWPHETFQSGQAVSDVALSVSKQYTGCPAVGAGVAAKAAAMLGWGYGTTESLKSHLERKFENFDPRGAAPIDRVLFLYFSYNKIVASLPGLRQVKVPRVLLNGTFVHLEVGNDLLFALHEWVHTFDWFAGWSHALYRIQKNTFLRCGTADWKLTFGWLFPSDGIPDPEIGEMFYQGWNLYEKVVHVVDTEGQPWYAAQDDSDFINSFAEEDLACQDLGALDPYIAGAIKLWNESRAP